MTTTPDSLIALASILLSLIFEYIPGSYIWHEGLSETQKRLVMLGLITVTVGIVFGLGCANQIPTTFFGSLTCDRNGIWQLIWLWAFAVGVNQGTHRLTKKPETVP